MRILAIGDIHGCSRALDALLAALAPQPDDLVITLGDYVDRGPDSSGVLDRLLALHATGRHVGLRGNHDQMMLMARAEPWDSGLWLACGGDETLASYGIRWGDAQAVADFVPEGHWRFLEDDCVDWFETERHFFVHANAYPDVPLAEQPLSMLYWEKLLEPCAHVSGKVMVCGHTPQKGGRPRNLGTTVCIDTGVYAGGWLTGLDVLTGRYWQADEGGAVRAGWLDEAEDPA
jgi:serine/threonine protein phosphatase 1